MTRKYSLKKDGRIQVTSPGTHTDSFILSGVRYVAGETIRGYLDSREGNLIADNFYRVNRHEDGSATLEPIAHDRDLSEKVRGRFTTLMNQRGYERHIGSTMGAGYSDTPLEELDGRV